MNRRVEKGESRRCSALRKRDGKRCEAWALRGPDGETAHDPPLCVWHAGSLEDGDLRQAQAGNEGLHEESEAGTGLEESAGVAATVEEGLIISPERGEALYAPFFSAEEFEVLKAVSERSSLQGEIVLARGMLRWLMMDARAGERLTGHKLERRAATVFAGTDVLARMLQVERELEIDPEGVPRPIAEALDEIGEEWGIDL